MEDITKLYHLSPEKDYIEEIRERIRYSVGLYGGKNVDKFKRHNFSFIFCRIKAVYKMWKIIWIFISMIKLLEIASTRDFPRHCQSIIKKKYKTNIRLVQYIKRNFKYSFVKENISKYLLELIGKRLRSNPTGQGFQSNGHVRLHEGRNGPQKQ